MFTSFWFVAWAILITSIIIVTLLIFIEEITNGSFKKQPFVSVASSIICGCIFGGMASLMPVCGYYAYWLNNPLNTYEIEHLTPYEVQLLEETYPNVVWTGRHISKVEDKAKEQEALFKQQEIRQSIK